jgi:hypothetical protein
MERAHEELRLSRLQPAQHLPPGLADERKMGCAECCDWWCHFAFTNADGSDREDADALRAEIRRLNLESHAHSRDEEERATELRNQSGQPHLQKNRRSLMTDEVEVCGYRNQTYPQMEKYAHIARARETRPKLAAIWEAILKCNL